MKIKNRIKRFMVLAGLITLAGLFFLSPKTVSAMEMETGSLPAPGTGIMSGHMLNDEDVPAEIKEPIEKGKSLLKYIVSFIGWGVAIISGILWFIGMGSHNADLKTGGFIGFLFGVGIALTPVIVDWLIS